MIRAFYRSLIWIHPPSFKHEFGAEMLSIFDEARFLQLQHTVSF